MTGIQDDLATLRWPWDKNTVEVMQAHKRVEDEIARLNEALTLKATYVADAIDRAEAAEAEVARLDRIVSGHISRADRREGMVVAYDYEGEYVGCIGAHTWRWLLDSGVTEDEIARLKDGLRRYAEHAHPHIREIARALLAEDGAARQRHGRDCRCTPCQAEDWDAIDAGLGAA